MIGGVDTYSNWVLSDAPKAGELIGVVRGPVANR